MRAREWTTAWPQAPGVFLFYGYPNNKDFDMRPQLLLANVTEITERRSFGSKGQGLRAITFRGVIDRRTGAEGIWLRLFKLPSIPSQEELDEILSRAE